MEVAHAAFADTVDAARLIRAAAPTMAAKKDQKWRWPRNRGRVSTAGVGPDGWGSVSTLTRPGYGTLGFPPVLVASHTSLRECVRSVDVSFRSFLSAVVYGAYGRRLIQQAAGRHPRHIAIMLDGNRRWAREVGFINVSDGHRVGARKIADFLSWCREADVEVVTMWLLSTDNLNRAADEVAALLEIIADVVDELAKPETQWQLRIVGALDLLPGEIATRLRAAEKRTVGRRGMGGKVPV